MWAVRAVLVCSFEFSGSTQLLGRLPELQTPCRLGSPPTGVRHGTAYPRGNGAWRAGSPGTQPPPEPCCRVAAFAACLPPASTLGTRVLCQSGDYAARSTAAAVSREAWLAGLARKAGQPGSGWPGGAGLAA